MNEFIEACKSSSEDKEKLFYGCINVDEYTPHVNQLWGTVSALIPQVNEIMRPFLQIFGIGEGKGLSSF